MGNVNLDNWVEFVKGRNLILNNIDSEIFGGTRHGKETY